MLSFLKIENFKSLRSVELRLGPLCMFVGTNASGKSNLFDALRVLQGIGYGFTIEEILNGKPKSASSEVWEPLRGGSDKATFVSTDGAGTVSADPVIRFQVQFWMHEPFRRYVDFVISIDARRRCVRNEQLSTGKRLLYDSTQIPNKPTDPVLEVRYYRGKPGRQPHLRLEKNRPVLHQLANHEKVGKARQQLFAAVSNALGNMQRLDPSPRVLRDYSQARAIDRMGERGENFAALLSRIFEDHDAKSAYVSWLQKLTPTEVDDVRILKGALQEPLFALVERGTEYPAPILSDGTLRFAAIAAALFQPDMPGLLTVEEVENGIHPSRTRLLLELLKSRSSPTHQLMATTHSPALLAWLSEKDFRTTFLCQRHESTGESVIRPLSRVPHFLKLAEKQSVADLFTEGWLETVP